MPENPTSMPEPSGENTAEVVAGKNDANVPEMCIRDRNMIGESILNALE